MKTKKVLNLYGGIGGNRKLWKNCQVTMVESDPIIAEVYKSLFPEDIVIVGDAHEYLLKNYMYFDIIWLSPQCPTHSNIRKCGVLKGQYEALYPDMRLYQEIILLDNFARLKTKWIVENVKPYYTPLIEPTKIIGRHVFWTNFNIPNFSNFSRRKQHDRINGSETIYGFNIKNTAISDKRKVLRNMVDPKLGKHIFDCASNSLENLSVKQTSLFEI